MKKIDLQTIIDGAKLDPKELGEQLFPGAKFPAMALKRILKQEAVLNADQIVRLSSISGLTISQLFDFPNDWKEVQVGDIDNEFTLATEEFTAKLNLITWRTKIEYKGSLICEEILCSKVVPLSEYIKFLNNQVTNLNK